MTIEQWLTDRAPIWSRSDLSVALGALEAVTAIARQHARVPADDGTLDVYDPAGELADDILDAIATALGVEP